MEEKCHSVEQRVVRNGFGILGGECNGGIDKLKVEWKP